MSIINMKLDINTATADELAEYAITHCILSGFHEDEVDKMSGVADWFIQTQVNITLFNLIQKGFVEIIDFDDKNGPVFVLSENGKNLVETEEFNCNIWNEISQIIERKDSIQP